MARINFDMQLKELKNQMLLLGTMVEEVITETITALIAQDCEKAKEVALGDEKIDAQVRHIEQDCYTLLLRQQPIARDLRTVTAVLKIITDMERIGDHGTDISEITMLMCGQEYPEEIALIEQMSKEASVMLIDAVNAFAEDNAEKAEQVIKRDDIVDELFVKVKEGISENIKEESVDAMQDLDLLMVAKYFERIADHTTNVAEWVIYSIG